jgi:DNA-binding response OmpR family regulator
VIDDEQGIRNILDTLLSRKGYDVVLADGGRKVSNSFGENVPMSWCWISKCQSWVGLPYCSRFAVSVPISGSSS